jgi:peptidoglycan/LPS O-acetylase OafA/YrhL
MTASSLSPPKAAPSAASAPSHLPALTGLRFVAAIWVVIAHYSFALHLPARLLPLVT